MPEQDAAPELTGSPIEPALAELDTLSERDLSEHPEIYERIHAELQSALSAIDDA